MLYNFNDLSFQILTVDRFWHKEGVFEVRARPFAALSFRVNGTGYFEVGGKSFVTNPGDVLFLPANTPYKVNYSFSESIVVHFERCNYFEPENITLQNSPKIGICFEHLLKTWKQRHSINNAKSVVYDILDIMETTQNTSVGDPNVIRCINYMNDRFDDPQLDVEALCDVALTSVSSLQRVFKKHFGMAPKQYLIQLRMNRALELLTENGLSVKDIAFACGFSDEKYFSRLFKKKYGYSPSQFRRNTIV